MIRACIFDLGGTIVDRYSLTPFLSLKKVFRNYNISVTNKLIFKETIVDGFENAPRAFLKLFSGENFGKLLIKV